MVKKFFLVLALIAMIASPVMADAKPGEATSAKQCLDQFLAALKAGNHANISKCFAAPLDGFFLSMGKLATSVEKLKGAMTKAYGAEEAKKAIAALGRSATGPFRVGGEVKVVKFEKKGDKHVAVLEFAKTKENPRAKKEDFSIKKVGNFFKIIGPADDKKMPPYFKKMFEYMVPELGKMVASVDALTAKVGKGAKKDDVAAEARKIAMGFFGVMMKAMQKAKKEHEGANKKDGAKKGGDKK